MSKRWTVRPDGSNWGDFGDDDELGRINLLTAEKVREGAAEVREGRTFSLSLPLDFPGGNVLNQRRHPPRVVPTEDMDGTPDVFFNIRMDEMPDWGDPRLVDVWSDDAVTLWLQYSTQWDSLAHVGAQFDVHGDGTEEAVYYNGYRAGTDLVGPTDDARGDGSDSRSCARHLGLEHMAVHGVQGRGVLIDLHAHVGDDWVGIDADHLAEIMAADDVVVEPGDIVLFHTGFATRVLEWDKDPDPRKVFVTGSYLQGRDPKLLDWITETGLAAIATDNYAVEGMLGIERHRDDRHSFLPLHHHCLFKLGVPLGEMWFLDELATWLRTNDRNRFLLTAPPLRLPGVVGSPLTPVATV